MTERLGEEPRTPGARIGGPDAIASASPAPARPGSEMAETKLVETHVSTLFFVGRRVYKLRKPVQFDFLDFRQRITRREDCEREVALNRRLAPDVYLGVADLSMEGLPIDHLVVMRRMPETRRLATLARQGSEIDPWLHQVAQLLVAFHAGTLRSPEISADATAAALIALWQASFSETDAFVGTVLDEDIEAEIRALAIRWIEGREALLDARITAGRVCDGHGDLQAEDIFCLDDGVRILDCIEFSDQLRHGDVCADVTFLAMDLERIGCSGAAGRFLGDYQQLADDPFPETLIHHYIASHAYVRAKVACLRSAQQSDGDYEEARQLQALARDHLRRARVRLVLVGGLPGCGKSTLAAGLAAATGWTVLRSDEIRGDRESIRGDLDSAVEATPEGVPAYREGRYRPAVTAAVYQELLRRAEHWLGLGQSVVLDASWIDGSWRERAGAVATRTRSDLVEFQCEADPDEAAERIVRRLAEQTDISEATPAIGHAMGRSADPWPSAIVVDTSALAPDEAVAWAVEAVR